MVFKNKEVIELSGGKKYIVVDTMNIDDVWYYYLCEISDNEKKVKNNFRTITTVEENGHIFVKSVKGNRSKDIEAKFKEKLKID